MAETVIIPTGDALAIRRLLWAVGASEDIPHDQRVECLHWASTLDAVAGMPPWPTPGKPTQSAIRFYEQVSAHLQEMIEALRTESE